jgi:hypothetical protein
LYDPSSRKKLLFVEDNPAIATHPGERLAQQAGYQVIVAGELIPFGRVI